MELDTQNDDKTKYFTDVNVKSPYIIQLHMNHIIQSKPIWR